jgi:phage terminase large subunit-like protein
MPRLTRVVPFIRPGTKEAPTATALPRLHAKTPSGRFLEFCSRFLVHVKGPLTGQPVVFARWQIDRVIRPLFDTRLPDGRRQYRVCYLTCPRKQGKSTIGAAIALYLLYADGEGGAEIISAASSADQAAIIFDTARSMVERSPALREMTMIYRRELRLPSLGASYRVISAEAGTAHGLNLSGCVIDELHVWPDRALYDALTTSTGGRAQPVTFIATTAGDREHSIGAEVHRHAEQVRDGIVADPQLLPVIFAAPDDADWQDEAVWHACNPAIASGFRDLDEMRSAARHAQDVPGREASFRRLYLNQWGTAAAERWLPLAAWDACKVPPAVGIYDPARKTDLVASGRRAVLGLDLSTTTDLTALVIVLPDDEGGFDIRAEFWCPADSIAARARNDRVPYPLWVQQGHLTATAGNSVDYGFIEARIMALMDERDIVEVAVDPWNARDLTTRLKSNGVPVVEVQQTMANLSSGAKALETLVLSRKLRHDGHPVLRWNVSNAVADRDSNDNLKPSKKRSHERIDGVSALVTALARAIVRPQAESVYEHRGVIVL